MVAQSGYGMHTVNPNIAQQESFQEIQHDTQTTLANLVTAIASNQEVVINFTKTFTSHTEQLTRAMVNFACPFICIDHRQYFLQI